jgi:segregation and condensation protein B
MSKKAPKRKQDSKTKRAAKAKRTSKAKRNSTGEAPSARADAQTVSGPDEQSDDGAAGPTAPVEQAASFSEAEPPAPPTDVAHPDEDPTADEGQEVANAAPAAPDNVKERQRAREGAAHPDIETAELNQAASAAGPENQVDSAGPENQVDLTASDDSTSAEATGAADGEAEHPGFALEHPDAHDEDPSAAVADLIPIVEAVVFASDKPVTLQQLRRLTGAAPPQIKEAVAQLQERYKGGVELAEVSSGFLFRTREEQAHWVRRLVAGKPQRLTRAMLETLAIVAYRQPITRPEIDDIRGVDCGGTLRVLLERNLIRIVGKKEEVGRPLLYGTTKYFLEFFQLKDLKGLPTLRAFAELSEEHRQQVEAKFAGDAASSPAPSTSEALAAEAEATAGESTEAAERPTAAGAPTDSSGLAHEAASASLDPASTAPQEHPASSELAVSAPPPDTSAEDEELMSVLDRALERADGVLKREKKREPPASGAGDSATPLDDSAAKPSTPPADSP